MFSSSETSEDDKDSRGGLRQALGPSSRTTDSYHSLVSGFHQTADEEGLHHISTHSGPAISEEQGSDGRGERGVSLLGLSFGSDGHLANRLSKHTSTQTLRAESESVSDRNNDDFNLDWDNDSQTETTTVAPIQTHASNTWSASSKAARSMSYALKFSDDMQPSSPTILSCSLPNASHMPQSVVRESWDDDFLFQDAAEEQKSSEPSRRYRTKSEESAERGSWERDEEEEGDWGAALSVREGDRKTLAATNSALSTSKSGHVSMGVDHLEQSEYGSRDRSAAAGSSSRRRPSIPQSRIAKLSISTVSTGAGPFFRDKTAARSDDNIDLSAKKDLKPSEFRQATPSVAPSSRSRMSDVGKSFSVKREATLDQVTEGTPRSSTRIVAGTAILSTSNTPAKVLSRQSGGHWSQFLSSKLHAAKSPEKVNRKSELVKNHDSSTIAGSVPLRTKTPPVSPSALRSRELSKSKNKPMSGDASSHSHRRGGTSLSMSFGLMTPWGRHHRSLQTVNDATGSLAGASSSSVSLASITADTGRSASGTLRSDNNNREERTAGDLPDVYERSSSSSGPLQRSASRGNKRELDGHERPFLERRKEVQNKANTVTVPLSKDDESISQALTHSPSSYRAPLMSLSTRSHSGSASTATTALSSSDCTTSTECMTEESTLYGSVDDASKDLSATDSSTYFVPVATPSMQGTVTSDVTVSRSAEKAAKSARRIRVSTTRTLAANDKAHDTSRPMRSPTEVQLRLPSDGVYATTLTNKNRDGTVQGGASTTGELGYRRSSLSDLRIPSRITKAQESIRTNMSRVKDFANGIEELTALRERYQNRVSQYSATDPSRLKVEEEYGSWWECAEVLIGLGQGKGGRDDETNIDTLDQVQPFSTSPSDSSGPMPAHIGTRRTHSAVSSASNQAGARPPSSRASSSRSIDPQREMDILSAMLAGTPMEDISPIRPGMFLRERTLSANEGQTVIRSSSGSGIVKQHDAQGQLALAGSSTTSLSFANADASHHRARSRSHRASASMSNSTYLRQRKDAAAAQYSAPYSNGAGSSTVILGALSTGSVDTQGAPRRMRLRDTGRAGLQGLKELLRIFKISSSALMHQAEPSQSKVSFTRTLTDEPRNPFEDRRLILEGEGEANDEVISTPMSRTRSLISKTMSRSVSHSPALQRRSLTISVDDSHLFSRSNCIASSHECPARILSRSARVSSGGESSTKDTSLDSDWTQGDFDQLGPDDVNTNTRPELSFEGPEPLLAKSNDAGKRRFFLFSKGFPPSAARRHSKDILDWASSSKESFDSSPTRQSLQLPAREATQSPKHSSLLGGMPRATSSAKHPLLDARPELKWRSISSSSSLASPTSMSLYPPDYNATVRRSKGSTTATVSTIESSSSSSSSGGTQIATPSTEAYRFNAEPSQPFLRVDSSTELLAHNSCPVAVIANTHRKLALKPEAIPSLLVYLEATKARCQESLALLLQDAVHSQK